MTGAEEYLDCHFCPWRVPGSMDAPAPWEQHMAKVHPDYWQKRATVIGALAGHGVYDMSYPQARGRVAYVVLQALGLTPKYDPTGPRT